MRPWKRRLLKSRYCDVAYQQEWGRRHRGTCSRKSLRSPYSQYGSSPHFLKGHNPLWMVGIYVVGRALHRSTDQSLVTITPSLTPYSVTKWSWLRKLVMGTLPQVGYRCAHWVMICTVLPRLPVTEPQDLGDVTWIWRKGTCIQSRRAPFSRNSWFSLDVDFYHKPWSYLFLLHYIS
jgi:hypothetical protein